MGGWVGGWVGVDQSYNKCVPKRENVWIFVLSPRLFSSHLSEPEVRLAVVVIHDAGM
jgi:hypothetical protein